jgi:MYXO-CTERM domain-containing protein
MRAAVAACALSLAFASTAWAHGGLPVSESILRQNGGDTMYVPVLFWGVWVGAPGQPWRWICEEEINNNRQRKLALSTDGTFYATDSRGLTVSNDNGCTWNTFMGEITTRRVTDVVAHPTDGATAYLTTADTGPLDADGGITPGDNALYVTHDHGATFNRLPGLQTMSGRLFEGVRVAPSNPMVLYVTSITPGAQSTPSMHRSDDGGATFNTYAISYTLSGVVPENVEPFAVDPRDPQVVWVRASITVPDSSGGLKPRQAMLRSSDRGQSFVEVLVQDGVVTASGSSRGLDGFAIDSANARVYASTASGVFGGADPGGAATVTMSPIGNLSQAQCVDVHGGSIFACSNNYTPDNAALAESDDNGQTFRSILRYADTEGPVDCPASTPVGQYCPLYWYTYGSMLGIEFTDGGVAIHDGGTDPGGGGGGCSCSFASGSAPIGAALALMVLVALFARRRVH